MKKSTVMTRIELLDMMQKFSVAYDVVRIVDPKSTKVMTFDGTEYKEAQFEPCFSVWEKDERCENCVSLKACVENHRMTKFEFKADAAYSVVSVPILVKDGSEEHLVALELVNKVSEETLFQAKGESAIAKEVGKLNQRAYEDSLTGAYNRRYYDENLHVYDLSHSLPEKMGYLVIDVDRFKFVNDNFGHANGDRLLVAVAEAIRKNVRQSDRLMRIGGDEFLLVLRDCSKLFVEKKLLQLQRAVTEIYFDWMEEYKPSVSIGMSFTDSFDGTPECLETLFTEADAQMYRNKAMPIVQNKTMLIVDDIMLNREVLKQAFQEEFRIIEAEDGEEALKLLKERIIDVVITDIYMPKMDGLTLTREIRKDPEISHVTIFVITERGETHEIEALEAGADDFINKPFNPDLLNHRMRGVLAQNTVFNRVSQYQLSFNQNQIAFATVRLEEGQVVFQYVNEAFSQLMSGTPQEFVSGKQKLHFEGLEAFLEGVLHNRKRNTMTAKDTKTKNYYDIVAYAQDHDFCSFIVLKNEAMKLVEINEKQYKTEFENLVMINPDTFGALFVDLTHGVCENAYGYSPYLNQFTYPIEYSKLIDKIAVYTLDEEGRTKFLHITDTEYLLSCHKKGKLALKEELPFRLASGAIHWMGVHVKLIENLSTEEPKAIIYCVDIHEQKISQFVTEAVSKRNFDTFFYIDTSAQTAQVYAGDGKGYWSAPIGITQIDEAISEYLQIHYQETDKEQFIKENAIPVIVEKMKDMESYTVNYPLIEDDGKVHLKKGTYTWLDKTKTLMCFTREDITEVIQKEQKVNEELQKVNEELVHASNAKVEFLSRMSHDIRTPMNTILGLTALATDDIANPEKMKEYLENINASGKFLLGLVNDILDMDKINRGEMHLNREPYEYKELISGIKLMFSNTCEQKGITLKLQSVVTNEIVMTDRIRLNQIFFNVLSNAVKYTPEGGEIVYTTRNMKIKDGRVSCDYMIRDSGIGMSEEFQKNMFQSFSQEGKNAEVSSQGTGLGLSITKSLIDLMGGSIRIESKENVGTRVIMHLEFDLATEEEKKQKLQKEADAASDIEEQLSGLKVLLVEDHPMNQKIAMRLLEKKGMHVICADNGKEGYDYFEKSQSGYFDVILMDIRMPVMDGIEATKAIRALDKGDAKTVPIIAMTANAYTEDVLETKDAGMNGHVSKPIDVALLCKTIAQVINGMK